MPYTAVRDGTAIELEVPLMRRQPSALLRSLLAGSVIGNFAALFCLVLGFVVFLLRPRDTAARLLLLILIYYELLRVIHETIQPDFAGLWLREPGVDKVTK